MSAILESIAGQIILAGGALAALSRWVIVPAWKGGRALSKAIHYVADEMKNNGGSTLRDAVDRIEKRLTEIEKHLPSREKDNTP